MTATLIAVAHGTRDPAGVAQLRRLADALAAARPATPVRLAFVDDAGPSVTAVRAGQRDACVVVPLLLTAASHSKGDIPASIQLARRSGRRVHYGRPLGPHPALLEVIAARLAEAGVGPGAPVLLAAAGTADPAANAELVATGRLLSEARGLAPVEVAFASATGPSVPEALDRLDRLGHPRAGTAVVPYFLATGHFAREVAAAARGATVTGVLGSHPALLALVWARYDEALGAPIQMNCDVCLYLAPVAGRADAVGAPQRPHPHPEDGG